MLQEYETQQKYVELVCKGKFNSLIFLGKHGLGKTFLVKETLKNLGEDFIYCRGVSTPLGLYKFLFLHRDKLIVFDDTYGLVTNSRAISLFSSVLSNDGDEREVMWNTTSKLIGKTPPNFTFKGRIILITNYLPKQHRRLFESRCLTYNFNFSREDVIDLMMRITEYPHQELIKDERVKIVEFINKYAGEVDLRLQDKVEKLYLSDRENWEKLAFGLFEEDYRLFLLNKLLGEMDNVESACEVWIQETGFSRATFFRLKQGVV